MTMPILYSFRRCPYAMRARLALAVSGQVCELREVVLRNKPQALLEASHKATVPVLRVANGEVLEHSLDIMLWALRQHDPECWLTPPIGSLDAMQAMIAANDGPFKQALDRYKYPHRFLSAQTDASEAARQFAEHHRDSAAQWLMTLQNRLENHDWLFGASPSLADMALLPFVRQFAHTDAAWFAAQPWRALARWLAHWESGALLAQVMAKYPPWQTGQLASFFPD
ncbi:glutathione S-transferase [Polaromonas sp. CG_9.5]|nr:glutathione S-transferase [Polaromonas sp. CG_9.5]